MRVQIDDKTWVDLETMRENSRLHGRMKAMALMAKVVGSGPPSVQTNLRLNRAAKHRLKWLAGRFNVSEAKIAEAAILLFDTELYLQEFIDAFD